MSLRFTQPTNLRNGERSPICIPEFVGCRLALPNLRTTNLRNGERSPICIPEFVGCRFALPNLRT
ncbi:hypothetical protein [Limnospira platensis]|uniref:hypothetical protein n=1 Tax=Limnospira platensis TaxID=118562 RepID=UPI003D9FCF46